MGPACSKPTGDIATAAGVAQLPKIHGGAVLDAWCGGDNSVVTAGADGRVVLYDAAAGTAKTLGVHAAAANGSADCLQDLIDAGSSLRHSASESSLRGGSATALELAEDAGQGRAASVLRNASVSEFEKYGLWGKPEDDAGGTSGG